MKKSLTLVIALALALPIIPATASAGPIDTIKSMVAVAAQAASALTALDNVATPMVGRRGCGSRGGPGYRKANGKCASWR